MHDRLIRLAEQRIHARPTSEDEARAALEWIAAHEQKTLEQLVEEMSRAAPHTS
jgi:hypothetical protein